MVVKYELPGLGLRCTKSVFEGRVGRVNKLVLSWKFLSYGNYDIVKMDIATGRGTS